jgi:Ca-activated chloride channel family protein
MEIGFANPQYLWFLLSVPILIAVHWISLRFLRRRAVVFANFNAVARVLGSGRDLSKNTIPLILRSFAIVVITLAISGMEIKDEVLHTDFDFVIAIDTSSSMMVSDYQPNRLEAAKQASLQFLDLLKSTTTQVGVVEFSSVAYTSISPTKDVEAVKRAITGISWSKSGGTAIGDALVTSSNLFVSSERPEAIILLTDGQSNMGSVLPKALELMIDKGTVVYVIGIGTPEGSHFGNFTISSKLDEDSLRLISESTGGSYFRVDSSDALNEAFSRLATSSKAFERIPLDLYLLLIGLTTLIIEWIIINTKYRTLP